MNGLSQKLYDTLNKSIYLLKTPAGWKNYLKFSAKIYKYKFDEAILIYAQRPDATMCDDFEIWNSVGRRVNTGAKGIPILKVTEKWHRTAYVYDIKDTNGETHTIPKLWALKNDFYSPVFDVLKETFKVDSDLKLNEEEFHIYLKNMVSAYIYDEITKLSEYENFTTAAIESVCFVMCERCGLENNEYEFDYISLLSINDDLMRKLGDTVQKQSYNVLKLI